MVLMGHKRLPLIIMIFVIAFSSCNNASDEANKIDIAEAIIEEYPDSALSILKSIPAEALVYDDIRAKYYLFLSLAKYKNYIDETNDSLIAVAVDYFTDKEDGYYAALAEFMQARILFNSASYETSILKVIEAEKFFSLNDPLWNARCNELMGDIYHKTNLLKQEIGCREKTINAYELCGRRRNILFAYCDLATAHSDNGEYAEALGILKDVNQMVILENDSLFAKVLLSISLPILLLNDRPEEVIDAFQKLKGYDKSRRLSSQDFRFAGFAMLHMGDIGSARGLLSEAQKRAYSSNDEQSNLLLEKAILQATGDTDKAVVLVDSLLKIQNTNVKNILSQSVLDAQQKYYADMDKASRQAVADRENAIWSIVIAALFLLIIIVIVARIHYLRMQKVVSSKIDDAFTLSEEISSKDKIISEIKAENQRLTEVDGKLKQTIGQLDEEQSNILRLEAMVGKLFSRQFSTINSLCEQYYDEESLVNLKLLYNQVIHELDTIRDPKTLSELVDIVNLCKGNVINIIKNDMPSISQDDIYFLGLLFSGFSIKTIAVVLKLKPKGVYTKRQRLFDKIRSNTTIDPNKV